MTQSLISAIPTFPGLDGLPLTGGYVYFGDANQDPRQYPKDVFYDKDLTVPASQPLRTNSGFLWRNGSPTSVWAAGSGSLLVLDAQQRQVYYFPDWSGIGIVADITAVASNAANITAVAGNVASVNAVAGAVANVSTVAGAVASVNTTAGSIANVNTVAGSIANVNTVAGYIADVNEAAASASAAALSALVASTTGVTVKSTYALGLAAVADGYNFGTPDSTGKYLRVYKRVATKGVLQYIRPYVNLPGHDTLASVVQSPVVVGSHPYAPLIDFDSTQVAYGNTAYRSLSASTAPGLNLIAFGATDARAALVAGNGAVIAEGATDPTGGTKALNITCGAGAATANQPRALHGAIIVPAGQWTMAFEYAVPAAQPNDTFSWRPDLTGAGVATAYQSVTATTTYQTASSTFEVTTDTTIQPVWFSAATPGSAVPASNVNITNLRIIPGSAAGSIVAPVANIEVANFNQLTLQDEFLYSSNGSNNGNVCVSQLPASRTLTAFSFVEAVNFDGFYSSGLSALFAGSSYDNPISRSFLMSQNEDTISGTTYRRLILNGGGQTGVLSSLHGVGWITVGVALDATGWGLYLNGKKVYSSTTSVMGLINAMRFLVLHGQFTGLFGSTQFPFSGLASGPAVFDRKLTDAEMLTASNVQKARAMVKGANFSDYRNFIIAEGDSITAGAFGVTSGFSYVARGMQNLYASSAQGWNFAVSSSKLLGVAPSMAARQASVVAAITNMVAAGKRVIVSTLIGTNDMAAITSNALADQYYADLCAAWAAYRAAGAKVVAHTLITQSGDPNAAQRTRINTSIRGDATKYDALADYAADAALNVYSGTNYSDTVHLNDTGTAVAAPIWQAAVTTQLV